MLISSTMESVPGSLTNDRWALETCLEGLSLALDVPFQALNLSASRTIDEEINTKGKVGSRFGSLDEFCAHLGALPSEFPNFVEWTKGNEEDATLLDALLRRHLYLTPTCYANPLIKTFREHQVWRLWESIFLFRSLRARNDQGASPIDPAPPFPHGVMGAGFPVPEIGAFVVSWPVKRFTVATTLGDHRTVGIDLVDYFVDALEIAKFAPQLSRSAMLRFANLRTGITTADFEHRLSIAATALQGLAELPFAAHSLGRANLTTIALALCYMATMVDYRQISTSDEQDAVTYGFRLRGLGHEKTSSSKTPALVVCFIPSSGRLAASIDPDWNNLSRGREEEIYTNQLVVVENGGKCDGFANLDRTYSWFLDTANARRNAYDYETSLLLRAWCSEYVSDIVKIARGASKLDDQRTLSLHADAVAVHVRNALSADLATVAFYRRSDRNAILLGLCHSLPDQTEPVRNFIADKLCDIAAVAGERQLSMTYRAIDLRKPQACFHFDPEDSEASSVTNSILIFPPELKQPLSQNVAPINVYGRPWGVLSVAGLRPYQFSANAVSTLADLADFFSTYIYNQWTLALLDTMNSAATAPNNSRAEKYEALCRGLCPLLLADAATLWTAHAIEEGRFDLVAWASRPDLDLALRSLAIDRDEALSNFYIDGRNVTNSSAGAANWPFSLNSKVEGRTSGAVRAIAENLPWIQGRLGEQLFSGAWFEKEHTRSLKDSDFKSICIVPARTGGTVRGFFALFNRDSELYAEPWRDVMRIVSEEIALLIQAIEIQTTMEQNLFSPLRHEVTPAIRNLRERVKRLKNLSLRLNISDESLFRDYFLVQSDIESSTEDLEKRLLSIAIGGHQENRSINKDIILQEAEQRVIEYNKTVEDLRDIFHELTVSHRRQSSKHLHFIFRGPRKVLVAMDRITLREILGNLITNAVKYAMPHDEVIGQVRELPHALEFSLSNVGPTLSHDERHRLFNKGFRGAAARRSAPDGSGLGLYYVRELCRLYGITAEYRQQGISVEGQSRHVFSILIPRARMRKGMQ